MKRAIAALLITAAAPLAADDSLPFDDGDACRQGALAQFGQYLGDWKIDDEQLARDGSGWQPGAGARWIFSCLGEGTAIQDFWIPNDGPVGTNLRTWNEAAGRWDIAWTIPGVNGFAHIAAVRDDDGNIVMHYVAPLPDPLRRITFFPATADGWHWKLEFSGDDGETWTEVYRIRATPWTG